MDIISRTCGLVFPPISCLAFSAHYLRDDFPLFATYRLQYVRLLQELHVRIRPVVGLVLWEAQTQGPKQQDCSCVCGSCLLFAKRGSSDAACVFHLSVFWSVQESRAIMPCRGVNLQSNYLGETKQEITAISGTTLFSASLLVRLSVASRWAWKVSFHVETYFWSLWENFVYFVAAPNSICGHIALML